MTGAGACDLLLTGASVVTVDDERRVIEPGALAITGDRIVAVDEPGNLVGWRAARTIDCTGMAVMPGLVDCHNHLFQSLARGLGETLDGWSWLSRFMWPYAGAIDHEEVLAAVRLGAVEAARAGTTAVLDHHYGRSDVETTLAVACAIEGVGLRGVVARGMTGPLSQVAASNGLPASAFARSASEELEMTAACIRERPPGSAVAVWPGPVNLVYTDLEVTRRSVELARSEGTGWHTHCSAPQSDPGLFRDAYGLRPVEWLGRECLLGPEATLAHATWVDQSEIDLIGEAGAAVAHCPVSNQYIPYGSMPLRRLRDAGVIVGLGTDGSACGHRQDLFEGMKQAILLQRLHTLDPEASWAEEAVELATREGARLLGIDAGVLAPGKLADITVVDLRRPHLRPLSRTVATLVYAARGSDVALTIVGGRIVYEEGRCTMVDEAGVMAEAQARSEELLERAGLQDLALPWRTRLPAGAGGRA
jgi:5-methylthioadenosine/S-adenosylhomocysteine deaminase